MTQQVTAILEPQTCCYAAPAPSTGDLLRPRQRNTDGLIRHGKRTRFRYPGLLHPVGHRKYTGFQRSTAHGGSIRMLSAGEIEEWYSRVAALQQGKVKSVGPLLEKSR